MRENWNDPFGVSTVDRVVKIKVVIPKGYSFCEEPEKNEKLQELLPCIAELTKLCGDCLYKMILITEEGPIRTTGYAANMIPSDKIIKVGHIDYQSIEEDAMKELLNGPQRTYLKIMEKEREYKEAFNRVLERDGEVTYNSIQKEMEKPDNKGRIYISGPISGYDIEERRKAFKEIQEHLEAQGYEVFNPLENGLPAEATTHDHMKRDIEQLMTCDYIYMMRRFTHSKGCKVEFDVATAIGLPVFFEESGEITKFE